MSQDDTRARRASARGAGPARMIIIRSILSGDRHRTQLARVVKEYAKGDTFTAMLDRMVGDGWIVALRGNTYSLTDKARNLVAPIQSVPMRPYVSPAPAWRRPGSDHSNIPSVAGGQLLRRQ